jgi:hypothetical protein
MDCPVVIQTGKYSYPGVFRAKDDARIHCSTAAVAEGHAYSQAKVIEHAPYADLSADPGQGEHGSLACLPGEVLLLLPGGNRELQHQDREVLGPLATSWMHRACSSSLYEETLRILDNAREDNWGFWEAFYDLCVLHKVGRSPYVLRDAFWEATPLCVVAGGSLTDRLIGRNCLRTCDVA